MSAGLLFNCDDAVAAYLFTSHRQPTFKFDRALGLVDKGGKLIGAVLFHNWNGCNIEISYYGKGTMTAGIVRCIARFILFEFDAGRLTAVVSKRQRRFLKAVQKLGFRIEGIQRCYYGLPDCNRNTGVRFVMFRERIEQLARLGSVTNEAM